MRKTPPNWEDQKNYRSKQRDAIQLFRRAMPLVESELMADLEPLCHLPSLLEFKPTSGGTTSSKGNLVGIELIHDNNLSISFRALTGAALSYEILGVHKAALTVWRVNDQLDMIQARFDGNDAAAYLQTGGAALFSTFHAAGNDPSICPWLTDFEQSLLTK